MTNEGPALDSRALAQDLTNMRLSLPAINGSSGLGLGAPHGGVHFQLNAEHFGSFESCLRHSATKAADPAITPASDKIEGFSGEVIRSNAAGFPRDQLATRTSASLVLHLSCATANLDLGR
ncbi:hypothetical protein EMCRGX_G008150 [Ephydatia muelleri]